jgi:UDPglucose 6-dehydrogenase
VEINDARKGKMADKIVAAMGGDIAGKTVALLGLTFKPNTDDMRDAPSLAIVPALQAKGATIRAFDPEGRHEAEKLLTGVTFAGGAYEAAEGADAVVIVTEWDQFRALDLDRLKTALKTPVLVDLRNVYSPADVRAQGFTYASVGRA